MFLSISFLFKSKNCQEAVSVNHLFHNFITITSIVKLNQTMIASLWVVHFTYLNFNKKCFYFHFLATEWLYILISKCFHYYCYSESNSSLIHCHLLNWGFFVFWSSAMMAGCCFVWTLQRNTFNKIYNFSFFTTITYLFM